jgi:hypothetical protein
MIASSVRRSDCETITLRRKSGHVCPYLRRATRYGNS